MVERKIESLARQLRNPKGILGKKVGEKMNAGNRQMNLETINQLELNPNDRILEIGMVNGFFVRNIFQIALKIVVSDPTKNILQC